jgi:hypothetical protein
MRRFKGKKSGEDKGTGGEGLNRLPTPYRRIRRFPDQSLRTPIDDRPDDPDRPLPEFAAWPVGKKAASYRCAGQCRAERATVLFLEFSEKFKSIPARMFRSNFMPLTA